MIVDLHSVIASVINRWKRLLVSRPKGKAKAPTPIAPQDEEDDEEPDELSAMIESVPATRPKAPAKPLPASDVTPELVKATTSEVAKDGKLDRRWGKLAPDVAALFPLDEWEIWEVEADTDLEREGEGGIQDAITSSNFR